MASKFLNGPNMNFGMFRLLLAIQYRVHAGVTEEWEIAGAAYQAMFKHNQCSLVKKKVALPLLACDFQGLLSCLSS